jgi:parvulin-like peptidyl-prolyl isomerase
LTVTIVSATLSVAWSVGATPMSSDAAGTEPNADLGSVNGEPIVREDVEHLLGGLHGAVEDGARSEWDLDRLMFRVVNDHLLAQEARALGMDDEPRIKNKVDAHRDVLMKNAFERDSIVARAQPTDEEVRALFRQQYRRVSLRILTAYDRDGAETALAEIRDGADLEALIGERSVDMYRLRGGLVEDLPRIDLIRGISDVVFDLQAGSLGGPVSTELGWSIFRVESFADADPARFEALKPTLQELVRRRKAKALRQELAITAREHHVVRVDTAVVAAIVPERLPDTRLMPKIDDPDAVVARVGEAGTVTAQRYGKALMERWSGVRNIDAAAATAPIILDGLINYQLLLAEAARRGYGERPEVQRRVTAFERQLLVTDYLEEILAAGIEVGPDDSTAYYEENSERFRKPPRIRLGQITVRTEELARHIAKLLEDGADLSWLAREHSTDRFAKSGGDRGWFVPRLGGDTFSEKVLAAEPGDVIEPFGVPDNWVVVKILVREEQGVYAFGEVSGNVRDAVFAEKFREELDAVIGKLRERSEIEIDEARVAALSLSGSFDENAESEDHGHGH